MIRSKLLLISFTCMIFIVTNQCMNSPSYEELDNFIRTGMIPEDSFDSTVKGIMFIPLDGCKCVQQAVVHINNSPDKSLTYVFSSESEKIIEMNTNKIEEYINVVKDVNNMAHKLGIVVDFPVLYKMDNKTVLEKIDINGTLMDKYFPKDGTVTK